MHKGEILITDCVSLELKSRIWCLYKQKFYKIIRIEVKCWKTSKKEFPSVKLEAIIFSAHSSPKKIKTGYNYKKRPC